MQKITAAALTALTVLFGNGANAAGLTVTDWAKGTPPLNAHSAIIEGPSEVGIVDVQQSKSAAHRLVADVLETGKSVQWVYVTHPHLDHFAGANIVRRAFPEAEFYGPSDDMNAEMAHQVETRRLALGKGTPGGAANLPETAPDYFETVPGDGLSLDGMPVEVLTGKGDHPDSSVLWVSSAETLIGGDVIFNKTHAFFGDHNNLDAWIGLVKRIQALAPKTVVAGHSDTRNPDGEIVDAQLAWLKDLKAAMARHDGWRGVRDEMVGKYPDYANAFIFEFSYGVRNQ
jgi:glyoxylase-like metal-dependent hydrolase (beta-lactamase superfamily II)